MREKFQGQCNMLRASKVVMATVYSDDCSVMGSPRKPQHSAAQRAHYEELTSLIASKIILVLPSFMLR